LKKVLKSNPTAAKQIKRSGNKKSFCHMVAVPTILVRSLVFKSISQYLTDFCCVFLFKLQNIKCVFAFVLVGILILLNPTCHSF